MAWIGEHGRPAGLRTTLSGLSGGSRRHGPNKPSAGNSWKNGGFVCDHGPDAFAVGNFDGNGFIGGGAILRRENLVLGVTTAATLWFVTVIGLCFGGGQISLGIAAFVLGMFALSGLRWFDYRIKQEQHGTLRLTTQRNCPSEQEIEAIVRKAGCKVSISSVTYVGQMEQRQIEFNLQWRGIPRSPDAPPFLQQLLQDQHMSAIEWKIS